MKLPSILLGAALLAVTASANPASRNDHAPEYEESIFSSSQQIRLSETHSNIAIREEE